MNPLTQEIAATAARIVVEEGLEYGPAKRRAVKQLGLPTRAELPGNDELEEAVFEYLSVFCADTQPTELRALRELAAVWMQRLAEFRPHLSGAVWRGTATRLSDIHLQLYCDDSKSAEIQLLSKGVDYDVSSAPGPRGTPVAHRARARARAPAPPPARPEPARRPFRHRGSGRCGRRGLVGLAAPRRHRGRSRGFAHVAPQHLICQRPQRRRR